MLAFNTAETFYLRTALTAWAMGLVSPVPRHEGQVLPSLVPRPLQVGHRFNI